MAVDAVVVLKVADAVRMRATAAVTLAVMAAVMAEVTVVAIAQPAPANLGAQQALTAAAMVAAVTVETAVMAAVLAVTVVAMAEVKAATVAVTATHVQHPAASNTFLTRCAPA